MWLRHRPIIHFPTGKAVCVGRWGLKTNRTLLLPPKSAKETDPDVNRVRPIQLAPEERH